MYGTQPLAASPLAGLLLFDEGEDTMPKIMPNVIALPNGGLQVSWMNIKASDTCVAVGHQELTRRCVQVDGAFDNGTLGLKGSQDGEDFLFLKDENGTQANYGEAAMAQLQQVPLYTKPVLGGSPGGACSINVTMTMAKP